MINLLLEYLTYQSYGMPFRIFNNKINTKYKIISAKVVYPTIKKESENSDCNSKKEEDFITARQNKEKSCNLAETKI